MRRGWGRPVSKIRGKISRKQRGAGWFRKDAGYKGTCFSSCGAWSGEYSSSLGSDPQLRFLRWCWGGEGKEDTAKLHGPG